VCEGGLRVCEGGLRVCEGVCVCEGGLRVCEGVCVCEVWTCKALTKRFALALRGYDLHTHARIGTARQLSVWRLGMCAGLRRIV
jgi:hypothetical protein